MHYIPPAAPSDVALEARGLPRICFVALGLPPQIRLLQRGHKGHRIVQTRFTAEQLNTQLGVTREQRLAMHFGSHFGWNTYQSFPAYHLKGRG